MWTTALSHKCSDKIDVVKYYRIKRNISSTVFICKSSQSLSASNPHREIKVAYQFSLSSDWRPWLVPEVPL